MMMMNPQVDVQRRERQKKLELGEALRAQMREREGRLQARRPGGQWLESIY